MTLRDELDQSEAGEKHWDVRDSDDKITIYLSDISSWIEICAYHDKVFKFLRNSLDIFSNMAEQCDCDRAEKICLLEDWVNALKNIKDRWFWDLEDEDN